MRRRTEFSKDEETKSMTELRHIFDRAVEHLNRYRYHDYEFSSDLGFYFMNFDLRQVLIRNYRYQHITYGTALNVQKQQNN
jgi:hypothetical protein